MTLSKHSPNRANFVHKVIAFRELLDGLEFALWAPLESTP
jgi:hypothetical protein